MILVARAPEDCARDHLTHMFVASGIRAAAFDARSRCSDVGEQAADLRDAMVQTQDIHEANSSLTDLDIGGNKIGDEGAIALAQALKATGGQRQKGRSATWPSDGQRVLVF